MVCRKHRILVMFYNKQGIPQVTQTLQCCDQLIIVTLMQSDTRLIQNVRHTNQTGTNLGCQTDTLCFSTRQGSRCTRQRQIIQTDIDHEPKSCLNLLQYLCTDHLLTIGKL